MSTTTTDLVEEYAAMIRPLLPLAKKARQMGLSSSAPLYYGVQRSLQRHGVLDEFAATRIESLVEDSDSTVIIQSIIED